MTTTISVIELKNNTEHVLDRAVLKGNRTVIKRQGKPGLVLMSADEYDSWEETNEILADKSSMKDLKEAQADVKAGRVYDWEDVKKELGIDVPIKTGRKSQTSAEKFVKDG